MSVPELPKPKLRWYQYSLRTLLVFVTLCAIPCSWLGVKLREAKQQREVVAAIEKLGGQVAWLESSRPAWLRSLLGDDPSVFGVYLDNTQITDAGLEQLKALNQLQHMHFFRAEVATAGLERRKWLNSLESMNLANTKATDAGLANLKGLTQLQWLDLQQTKVTDAGLENLKGLHQLQLLSLGGTKVTDEGVKKLQQALPNCKIER